jgi:hypothetical protein
MFIYPSRVVQIGQMVCEKYILYVFMRAFSLNSLDMGGISLYCIGISEYRE